MKARIRDIAGVQSGFQFRKKLEPGPAGSHWVIQIKDIDAGHGHQLDAGSLWRVSPRRDAAKDLLREGDVLYLGKGRRNYATPILSLPAGAEGTIAAGYFFVLRLTRDDIRPDYLAWYINQPAAQQYLAEYFRGTGIPFIRQDDFARLEVRIPPLVVQERIVRLHELALREGQLLARLRQKRARLIHGICMKAAQAASGPAKE